MPGQSGSKGQGRERPRWKELKVLSWEGRGKNPTWSASRSYLDRSRPALTEARPFHCRRCGITPGRGKTATDFMFLRRHKVRVVSVRFTQDEYDAITKACEAEEARSLSEYARMAMKERLGFREPEAGRIEDDVDAVAKRLEKVYQDLRATAEYVAGMLGRTK